MKKILVLLLCLFIITGCTPKQVKDYKNISDAIVSLYRSPNIDRSKLNSHGINLVQNFYNRLNNDYPVNISDYIIYDNSYKTDKPNTDGIYIVNDKCYINYKDIEFEYIEDGWDGMDEETAFVCNGYYAIIPKESITYDYDNIIKNPRYDYRFIGYYNDGEYHFVYRSYYDNSDLTVTIKDEVEVNFEKVEGINLKSISESSVSTWNIVSIVIGFAIIGAVVIVKKNNYI